MNEATRAALAALNRRFYADEAEAFDATRRRPWRGWQRLLPLQREAAARAPLRVLDVGCGNGRYLRFLAHALSDGRLDANGVDASDALLARAREDAPAGVAWTRLDVAARPEALPPGPFEWVVLWALLHGVPGRASRRALLEACARRVAPGGRLAFTTWHVDSPRRVDPSAHAIDAGELEAGDRLLPWGDAGTALRFVHEFAADEIAELCARPGFALEMRYRADGREGRTNEYFVLRRAELL